MKTPLTLRPALLHAALLCLLGTSGIGCNPLGVTSAPSRAIPRFEPGGIRVLFIGNSLTYYNDLGDMMAAVARSGGDNAIRSATVAFPDYALEDHIGNGTATRALREGNWEFVVLQQGPSSLPANQLLLADGARSFDRDIRAAGAVPVLFMVWPQSNRLADFPAVRTSYRNAAAAVRGIFAPAGDAWAAAWELDPSTSLYLDGLHANPAGTYLAAIVILHQLRGTDPRSLPRKIPGYPASEATVELLQLAARRAIDRNPRWP
ncbi:MAG TPA: hypothetical protein VE869_09230 [Gemmatimonas sp.]|nr:hypothetical protein [Gemmatimonas sp.]